MFSLHSSLAAVLPALLIPLAGAAFVGLVAGCPSAGNGEPPDAAMGTDTGSGTCPTGFLGDPAREPTLELRALRADGTDVALGDGDDLAIVLPPQGGRVAFLGVRATNVDGCAMQIVGALRDPLSQRVMIDGRTVNLTREGDGWGTTGRGATLTNIEDSQAIGDYSNVPLCPNSWADQDVFDRPFEVEVKITDRQKRTASKKLRVTPRCAEPGPKETACRCLCKRGYVLGETCGEDAGASDGGSG